MITHYSGRACSFFLALRLTTVSLDTQLITKLLAITLQIFIHNFNFVSACLAIAIAMVTIIIL